MSQTLRTFSGSLVALATPFGPDGQVDYKQLEALVKFQLEHHTDGIVALGTTAETPTLSQEEKDKIAQTVIGKVAGRIPVIVGAVLMGPVDGGILGLSFGIFSMIKASTAAASPADMAFSPFLSGEPVSSIVMCIIPRILLGVIAGGLYLLLSKKIKNGVLSMGISAVVATFCHSMMVLVLLSVLFQSLPLKAVLASLIGVNCLLEMLAAAVVAVAVCKPLQRILRRAK